MTAEEYQRIRLWAGVTGITLGTALVWAAYLAAPWFQFIDIPYALLLGIWNAAALLLLWPYDVFTGFVLEKSAGRFPGSFLRWNRDWLVGILPVWIAFEVAGLIFGYGFYLEPPLRGALYALLLIPAGLTAFHPQWFTPPAWRGTGDPEYERAVAHEIHEFVQAPIELKWFREEDPFSINAHAEPTSSDTVVLSENARQHLTPRQAALLCIRQRILQMFPTSKFAPLALLAWLLLGALAAASMPSTGKLSAAMAASAVLTTWCLVALFVLPAISRMANLGADRALAKIAGRGETIDLLETLQRLNATDRRLPRAIATIFHPIPPLETRLDHLP